MGKNWFLLGIALAFLSCGEPKEAPVAQEEAPQSFSFQDYPSGVTIDAKAQAVLKAWPEYQALENSFSVLKRATNNEDVILAVDDLVEQEKALAASEYPEVFDELQIKSRQQVFKTFLFKVKGHLVERQPIEEAMEQLVLAYNAFNDQFNILINNSLDSKLILESQ